MPTILNEPVRIRDGPTVVRVVRSIAQRRRARRKIPGAAVYKPAAKWPVVAAFMVALLIHIGAVRYFEPKPNSIASNESFTEDIVTQLPSVEPSSRVVPD